MMWLLIGLLLGLMIGMSNHDKSLQRKVDACSEQLITREIRLAYLYQRMAENEGEMRDLWNASVNVMPAEAQGTVQELFGEKKQLIQELQDAHSDYAECYKEIREVLR